MSIKLLKRSSKDEPIKRYSDCCEDLFWNVSTGTNALNSTITHTHTHYEQNNQQERVKRNI